MHVHLAQAWLMRTRPSELGIEYDPKLSLFDFVDLAFLDQSNPNEHHTLDEESETFENNLFLDHKDFEQIAALNKAVTELEEKHHISLHGLWGMEHLEIFSRSFEKANSLIIEFAKANHIQLFQPIPLEGSTYFYGIGTVDGEVMVDGYAWDSAMGEITVSPNTFNLIQRPMDSRLEQFGIHIQNINQQITNIILHENGHALEIKRRLDGTNLAKLFGVEFNGDYYEITDEEIERNESNFYPSTVFSDYFFILPPFDDIKIRFEFLTDIQAHLLMKGDQIKEVTSAEDYERAIQVFKFYWGKIN